MNKVVKALEIINISKPIANHMLGESHTPVHRMATGWFVITVGILITAIGHSPAMHIVVKYACDGIGYLIHGIGAVPTIEYVACKVKQQEVKQKEKKELEKKKTIY